MTRKVVFVQVVYSACYTGGKLLIESNMIFPPFLTKKIASMSIPNFLISVVDGGARDGGEPDRWKEIREKVLIHSFDPDPQCCSVVADFYSKEGYNLKTIPVCLGSCSKKNVPFHVTAHPASSSFFELDMNIVRRLKTYYHATGAAVSHASRGLMPDKIVEVETKSLDDLLVEKFLTPPDFIKLDVQGAELEVLKGSCSCLKGVVGVEVEVWFEQVYKNQPLFSDVDAFLRSQGFRFFNFRSTHTGNCGGRMASPLTFIHQQSNNGKPLQVAGQLLTTDAVYLRDFVEDRQQVITKEDQLKLLKLVVAAELVGQVEYAFEVLLYGHQYAQSMNDEVFAALCKKIFEWGVRQYQEANSEKSIFEVSE